MTFTLTAQDRFDIQEDIDRNRELLADIQAGNPEEGQENLRRWYANQEFLENEIRDLEALL